MITWRDGGGGLHRDGLFGIFAALARGDAWSFPALRPHQREPWHAFTVQVAALALIRSGATGLSHDEATWRDMLIGLTPDYPDGEAWALVVDDWTKPALLQPPVVAEANRGDYKSSLSTPDALDMLVTAKNHDVKQERIAEAGEEDWLFALVTLQTTEGFLGAGNYGISRMNGGFATRMSLGVRPSGGGASGGFGRDVRRLVADAGSRPDRRPGHALLWTEPWDGTRSLDFTRLDELYVEICRRVRLRRGSRGIEAMAAGSKCARIAAANLGGNTGDPWTPLVIDTKKDRKTFGKLIGLSPTGAGFGYRQMANLFDPEKVTPPLLVAVAEDDDREGLSKVATALVRGQGKTEGLHRRTVRTSRVEELHEYGSEVVFDRIGNVARTRTAEAGAAADKLRLALYALLQGAPSEDAKHKKIAIRLKDNASDDRARKWTSVFHARVDRLFFDAAFWMEVAEPDGDHRLAWRERLKAVAGEVFDEAAEAVPRTQVRRVRAVVRSRSLLDGQMHNWLKEVA